VLEDAKITQPIPLVFYSLKGIYQNRSVVLDLVIVNRARGYYGSSKGMQIYLFPKVSCQKQSFWENLLVGSKLKPTETTELVQNKIYYDINARSVGDINIQNFKDILTELTEAAEIVENHLPFAVSLSRKGISSIIVNVCSFGLIIVFVLLMFFYFKTKYFG
jgi:hypothetical protein